MSWAKVIKYCNNHIHGCQFFFEKILMEGPWRKNITLCTNFKMQIFLFIPLCAHNFDESRGMPNSARHIKYVLNIYNLCV
jgi:hypothetical protein